MFTGLVRETGRLAAPPAPSPKGAAEGGVRLEIAHSRELAELLDVGASLAVNGVCLTVTEKLAAAAGALSAVELSPETLRRTSLGQLEEGHAVNLEPALRMGDPLGGHWVQGHVDATLKVLERRDLEEHAEVAFELPPAFAPYLVEKGSVTLDGVSLTVSALKDDRFEVALIPHTLEVTTLGRLKDGQRVNFEIDVLAKYVERLLAARGLGNASGNAPGAGS